MNGTKPCPKCGWAAELVSLEYVATNGREKIAIPPIPKHQCGKCGTVFVIAENGDPWIWDQALSRQPDQRKE